MERNRYKSAGIIITETYFIQSSFAILYFSAVGSASSATSRGPFLSIRTIYSRNNCVIQKNALQRRGSRRRIALKHVAPTSIGLSPSISRLLSREITSSSPHTPSFQQREFSRELRCLQPSTICLVCWSIRFFFPPFNPLWRIVDHRFGGTSRGGCCTPSM